MHNTMYVTMYVTMHNTMYVTSIHSWVGSIRREEIIVIKLKLNAINNLLYKNIYIIKLHENQLISIL